MDGALYLPSDSVVKLPLAGDCRPLFGLFGLSCSFG